MKKEVKKIADNIKNIKKPTKKQVGAIGKTASKTLSSPLFLKVVGYGFGGYLAYKIASKILAGPKPDPTPNIDVIVTPNTNWTTINENQAKKYAQTLLEAMDRQPYGTYDDRILNVFNKINSEDFKLIYNAFGMQNYNGWGTPPTTWLWQQLDNYQPRNLVYWLQSELSDSKNKPVYTLVKNIVEDAGFIF